MPSSTNLHTRCDLSRRSLARAAGIVLAAVVAPSAAAGPAAARGGRRRRGRCFLRGTRIRTATGDRPVETLAAGDLIPARFGGMSPIKRVGHYHWRKADPDETWARAVKPVRIARSAIDDNVPSADLHVTPSHALLIDGLLVRAGDLVNGTTIAVDDAEDRDELEYYHIELERHDVIEAEGAPCETLLAEPAAGGLGKYDVPQVPCAPLACFNGGRSELASRLRSAASLVVDRRLPLDVIRDRLETRALAFRPAPPFRRSHAEEAAAGL